MTGSSSKYEWCLRDFECGMITVVARQTGLKHKLLIFTRNHLYREKKKNKIKHSTSGSNGRSEGEDSWEKLQQRPEWRDCSLYKTQGLIKLVSW